MKTIKEKIGQALVRIHQKRPLIHHITNMVTIHDCANALLAMEASPIMASHPLEVAGITKRSKALVLNLGTLQESTEKAIDHAIAMAQEAKVPVVLDPVGVGVSPLRHALALQLLGHKRVSLLRCNEGELKALHDDDYIGMGIDSLDAVAHVEVMAKNIARKYGVVVAVTGKIDFVTDGQRYAHLCNGVDWLPQLTGTGCMTTSFSAAFLTELAPYEAAIAGISYMSICGELAFRRINKGEGLGSFAVYLHDAFSLITAEELEEELRIMEGIHEL